MSHIVSFETKVKNAETLRITAQRMGLPRPEHRSNYRMRSGKVVSGVAVQLPDWTKPVIFDCETGQVEFDNWSPYDERHPQVRSGKKEVGDDGRWGNIAHLNQFVDEYLGTEMMLQAEEEGHTVIEAGWNAEEGAFKLKIKA